MTAMNGRVLTEEEIAVYEKRFTDLDTFNLELDLIATIRDRDESLALDAEIMDSEKKYIERLQQQNAILREALQQICKCDALKVIVWAEVNERDINERDYLINIAREALAKVNQKEVSTPDEPNRNAQTE